MIFLYSQNCGKNPEFQNEKIRDFVQMCAHVSIFLCKCGLKWPKHVQMGYCLVRKRKAHSLMIIRKDFSKFQTFRKNPEFIMKNPGFRVKNREHFGKSDKKTLITLFYSTLTFVVGLTFHTLYYYHCLILLSM